MSSESPKQTVKSGPDGHLRFARLRQERTVEDLAQRAFGRSAGF